MSQKRSSVCPKKWCGGNMKLILYMSVSVAFLWAALALVFCLVYLMHLLALTFGPIYGMLIFASIFGALVGAVAYVMENR